MSRCTFFVQSCPVCGRPLEICVEYLGKQLTCDHCGGQFVATDPANRNRVAPPSEDPLLRRAEELIEISARQLTSDPPGHLPSSAAQG